MASVTREPTSKISTPHIISPPNVSTPQTSVRDRSSTYHPTNFPSPNSNTSELSRATKKDPLRFVSSPLTGAAALRDEEQLREQQAIEQRLLRSPNPAMSTANELRAGPNGSMSKPSDVPPRVTTTSANGDNVTSTATVAEPMQIDQQPLTSPTSMTGSDNHSQTTQPSSSHSLHPSTASQPRSENKALTYPPQQQQPFGTPVPARGMTLPGTKPVKKHKCQHCATEFTRHHNLKSHLLTHSQEKPFSCKECNAKFRRLHDLKRHSKLHTGEKPHLCNKCGRKFARGDALARHSKGPGGCAGRRSSIGDEEYYDGGSNPDESMDIDEDPSPDAQRRKSEPNHHYRKPSLQVTPDTSTSSTRLHSSTFPGVAAMSRGASTSTGEAGPSTHLSPRIATASSHASSPHNAPASGFGGQGHYTESPGPLSPGQVESRRLSASQAMSYSRERSPSLSQPMHSQGWNPSHPAPSINHPHQNSHPPQLPSISGLTSDHRPPSITSSSIGRDSIPSARPAPLVNTQPHVHGSGSNSSTNPPSTSSSHRHSSGSSMRDIFSSGSHAPAAIPPETALMEHNRRLEAELRDMKAHMAHYDGILASLTEENARLKGHRQQQHQQQQQQQQQQRSEPVHTTLPEAAPPPNG